MYSVENGRTKKSSVGRGKSVSSFSEYGQFTKEVCMTAQMEILQRGATTQRSLLEREVKA